PISNRQHVYIKGLEKSYYSRGRTPVKALGPLDLELRAGEFVSVVGRSGCGKSTLLKVLGGLLTADGDASIGGRVISGPRRDVGIVFQNATLLPWRTVTSNVCLPLE